MGFNAHSKIMYDSLEADKLVVCDIMHQHSHMNTNAFPGLSILSLIGTTQPQLSRAGFSLREAPIQVIISLSMPVPYCSFHPWLKLTFPMPVMHGFIGLFPIGRMLVIICSRIKAFVYKMGEMPPREVTSKPTSYLQGTAIVNDYMESNNRCITEATVKLNA